MVNIKTSFFSFLLKLRLRQIVRACREVGFLLLFPLFFLFIGSLGIIESMSKSKTLAWALFIPLIPISIHFKRLDADFLAQLNLKKTLIYAFEYLLLALPIAILVSVFQPLFTVLLGLFLTFLIAFLPTRRKKQAVSSFLSFNFIPLSLFEWRFGFRKDGMGIVFILVYILALIGMFWEGTILVFTLFASFFIIPLFDFCEPKEWLVSSFSIWNKVKTHVLVWTALLLPHAIACWILHPDIWYFAIIAWYFGAMLTTFCIVYKYMAWSPFRIQVNNSMAATIFVLMLLIIFTSPACIFAIIYYWRKAKNNMIKF